MALAEEDPTFTVRTDEETGQTIIAGMGELHLEVLVDRMMREFRVDASVGKPQVAYRETLAGSVSGDTYTHKKQTWPPIRMVVHSLSPSPSASASSSTRSLAAVFPRNTSARSMPAARMP